MYPHRFFYRAAKSVFGLIAGGFALAIWVDLARHGVRCAVATCAYTGSDFAVTIAVAGLLTVVALVAIGWACE